MMDESAINIHIDDFVDDTVISFAYKFPFNTLLLISLDETSGNRIESFIYANDQSISVSSHEISFDAVIELKRKFSSKNNMPTIWTLFKIESSDKSQSFNDKFVTFWELLSFYSTIHYNLSHTCHTQIFDYA